MNATALEDILRALLELEARQLLTGGPASPAEGPAEGAIAAPWRKGA